VKTLPKVGLIVLSLILFIVLAAVLRFMSFGLSRQDWTARTPDLAAVADGTYRGRYRIVPPFGTFAAFRDVSVDVEVQGHAVRTITVVSPQALGQSLSALAQRVVDGQSLEVDAVSGGTWSSRALLKAVESALSARRSP
jgi:uncharacterized protein with FMN-binding domain